MRKIQHIEEKRGSNAIASAVVACPVAITCVLVLLRGGYYASATCGVGLIATAFFIVPLVAFKNRRAFSWASLCLVLVSMFYALSTAIHGATLTMLEETFSWFAIAGMSLWCAPETRKARTHMLNAFAMCGIVFAAAGILMYADITPIEDAVSAGRLMFLFQYANTAGLFFAVAAILCFGSSKRMNRRLAFVPVVALFLTQSGGALVVFALGVAGLILNRARRSNLGPLRTALALSAFAASCVVAVLLMRDRVVQASQTFVERAIQVLDALSLLAQNPLVGIGPGQWQFEYPEIQTAQYRAADVHCSYMQIALDAGVLALLAFMVLLAIGIWKLAKMRDAAAMVCVGMVAVHAAFDFDLQFSCMVLLLLMLLAEPLDEASNPSLVITEKAGAALACFTIVCALMASCLGIALDVRSEMLQNASSSSNSETARRTYDSASYLRDDQLMRLYVLDALLASGDYRGVVDVAGESPRLDAAAAMRCVSALYQLGDVDSACGIATDALHRYPYDVELFDAVRELVLIAGSADAVESFNAEAERANELSSTGRAVLLDNQKQVELIDEGSV